MPTYRLTAPDGSEYEVTGPGSEQEALAQVQSQYAQQPAQGMRVVQAGLNEQSGDASGAVADARLARAGGMRSDLVHSAGTGLIQGTLALPGLPGTVENAMNSKLPGVGTAAMSMLTGGPLGMVRAGVESVMGMRPNGDNPLNVENIYKKAEEIAPGSVSYQPKSKLGKAVQTTASFVPGFGEAGMVRNAIVPGIAYSVADQATEGSSANKYLPLAAALLAPGLLKNVGARAVTPFPASEINNQMADTLERAGIRVSAGQRTGSKLLRYAESELGGDFNERQARDLTRYAAGHVGENVDRLTPDVMQRVSDRLGGQFEYLGRMTQITPDRQFGNELGQAFRRYQSETSSATRKGAPTEILADIMALGRGRQPGSAYQKIRSDADRLARETADPDYKRFLIGVRHAIDEVMDRSIQTNTPHLAGEYRAVRRQYKNLQVLEDVLSRAGEDAKKGLVTPAAYESAVKKGLGKRNWNRSRGDAAEIARASGALLKPLPNSGTASRLAARAATGAVTGAVFGEDPWSSARDAAIGLAAGPAAVARILLSRPGRRIVGNQMLARYIRSPGMVSQLLGHRP